MTKSNLIFCRITAVLLILFTIFSTTIVANAQTKKNDDLISPQYTTIMENSTCISISGIKATCTTSITAQYPTSLKIKMELQKKKSIGYETVETWTGSRNGITFAMSESRNINVFSDYRLKATFTAGSETTVVYKYPV